MHPELEAFTVFLSLSSFILMVVSLQHTRRCWAADADQMKHDIALCIHALANMQKAQPNKRTRAHKRAQNEVRKNVGNPRKHGRHSATKKATREHRREHQKRARVNTK